MDDLTPIDEPDCDYVIMSKDVSPPEKLLDRHTPILPKTFVPTPTTLDRHQPSF